MDSCESDGSLSYLRDSLFAPGMLSRVGRPALDGFWRARPSFENGELVLLDAEQVDLMPVER
ncbi:MAG: hypothetical protein IPI67_38755 [Myxococcales bacterium]|nr:hypothetical protein [Myxococcales bacterium]